MASRGRGKADDDEIEDENDLGYDAQLTETINILSDYSRLMAANSVKANDNVALKKDAAKTTQATQ